MIDLYTWATPNGHKVHIMLEETGLEYTVHPIAIGKGEQFQDFFVEMNPNHRIPVMVDQDGPGGKPITVFESGAILIYLAEKTGQFLPADPHGRFDAIQWVMWQMGGLGPMAGQANHFRVYAVDRMQYATDRYTKEVGRLFGVLEKRLAKSAFIGGDDYTIADMACFPWLRNPAKRGQKHEDFPHLKRWFDKMAERPAVQRGIKVLEEEERPPTATMSDEEREIMFGDSQFQAFKK
jgi:GST-like protein